MGIEPTAQAWEAWVLPLYDARDALDSSRVPRGRQIVGRSAGFNFRAGGINEQPVAGSSSPTRTGAANSSDLRSSAAARKQREAADAAQHQPRAGGQRNRHNGRIERPLRIVRGAPARDRKSVV